MTEEMTKQCEICGRECRELFPITEESLRTFTWQACQYCKCSLDLALAREDEE